MIAFSVHKAMEVDPLESSNSKLERMFIEEYLESLSYTYPAMVILPEGLRKELMTAASLYASCKLAEIENRAMFVRKISSR